MASALMAIAAGTVSADNRFGQQGGAVGGGGSFGGGSVTVHHNLLAAEREELLTYLAPEVNLGTSNASGGISYAQSNSSGGVSSRYNSSYEYEAGTSYGVGLLAGYNITETTSIYGRLGYQRTNFELTESYSESATGGGVNFADSDSVSGDEDLNGVRYGVGIETALTPAVALRLDWSQTQYSDYSETDEWGETFSMDPTESQFQVGVSYRF